ncbi:MAG: cation:proton antiporter [Candidatus Bathyarchaeota archaeon]|nr:MAG: cation:proton antiporter [Candidatus Bathyarchaeota archaeon]
MDPLVIVPIILMSAFIFSEVFRKVGFPPVVGQILAGILLGISVIKNLLFSETSLIIVDFLSVLGIVFLLFLAGLEIDVEKIKETSRDSILISLSSALLPFFLGFSFLTVFFPEYGSLAALVFGGAIMVTSEGTKVKVLMDMNKLNTRLGAIMLAAGAIDDIFEVLLLALVVAMAHGGGFAELARIPLELVAFIAIAFVSFKIISKVFRYLDKNGSDETELFSMVVIFVLVLAALSQTLELGYLIGAIIGGFFLQISMKGIRKKRKEDMIRMTKNITLAFIVPFFFVYAGLNFELESISSNIFLLVVTVAIAFFGKIVGTLITKPFSTLNLRQLYYVGWAMNSRGAAEMVIALIAKQFGLIPPEIFSALVVMTIVTTFTFPFALARGINRNPRLMEG